MSVYQHFRAEFAGRPACLAVLEASAGTDDGKNVGQVLAEMPLECACGWECEKAMGAALELLRATADKAYSLDRLARAEHAVAALCADACVVFIRG